MVVDFDTTYILTILLSTLSFDQHYNLQMPTPVVHTFKIFMTSEKNFNQIW